MQAFTSNIYPFTKRFPTYQEPSPQAIDQISATFEDDDNPLVQFKNPSSPTDLTSPEH